MKELIAKNPQTGMQIIQRWIEKDRFLKVMPKIFQSLVLEKLKAQFKNLNVKIIESKTGWIKITKTGKIEKLEEIGKKLKETDEEELDENYILNKEAKILKSQGFIVTIRECGNGKN